MSWQWVANLGISKKLSLVIFPFLIGCLVFAGIIITDQINQKQNLQEVLQLTKLAEHNSNLVHQLQKERGMSAGFLGSKGRSFKNSLPQQRSKVDGEVEKLRDFLKHNDNFSNQLRNDLQLIKTQLSQLSLIRQRVNELSISGKDQVQFYSQLNQKLLKSIDLVAKQALDHDVSIQVASFAAFLQMKERAGIERAIASSMFGHSNSDSKFVRIVQLIAEQNSYQERFIALASVTDNQKFQQLLANSAIKSVAQLRSIITTKNIDKINNTQPETWFRAATSRIDLLRQFEKVMSVSILSRTQQKLNSANSVLFTASCSLFILLSLVLMLSFVIARYLSRTIKLVSDKVNTVGKQLDLSVRIDHTSTDELGEVVTSFNSMMEQFEQVIVNTRTSTQEISTMVQSLNSNSLQMQHDIAKGQGEVEQVASAMSEMSATVSQIAGNAVDAAQASKEANKEAAEGNVEVLKTDSSIRGLAEEMHSASNAINLLDKEIHSIVGVLDVISGIAEQTNLLALNAAIEAARAGESGRGFAVVADEVRGLAQRAKTSTSDIKSMTERLQIGAEEAVQAMVRGLSKADESVEEVKKAGEDLRQIVGCVQTIDEMNAQIATATQQQSTVTEDVSSNANAINELYNSSMQSSQHIVQLNEQLSSETVALIKKVEQFTVSTQA
ncbi:MAG: methyl-accepting chemotaxis protein [Parashewanella sp.]